MPNQKGFAPVFIFILGVLIASGVIVGGSFAIKSVANRNLTTEQSINSPVEPSPTSKAVEPAKVQVNDNISPQDPKTVISSFYQAVKAKDKIKARTFLSPNVNKLNFESTLNDNSSSPSLYTLEFTYEILDSKFAADGNQAFVNVNININNQSL